MKRLLLLLLTAALLLTACSETSPEPSASPSPSTTDDLTVTSKPAELTVWESSGGADEFIRLAAAEFQLKYPNITINVTTVSPDNAPARVEAAGGLGPDLFAVRHSSLRPLAQKDIILPVYSQEKTKALLQSSAAAAATVNGVLYGYPVAADTYALFYNKNLVSEPPATWDELIDLAKTLNGDNQTGFLMETGNAYYTSLFITGGSNRIFGSKGEDARVTNVNSAAAIEGMGIFKKLGGAVSASPDELTAQYITSAFANGSCAMCVTGSWNAPLFSGVNFGVAPLPALFEDDHPAYSLAEVIVMAVSSYSNHPDEASVFALSMLTDKLQKLRVEKTGVMPVTDIALASPSFSNGFIAQLSNAVPVPSIPEAERFWSVFSEASKNILGGADITAELNACNAAILTPPAE